MTLFVARGLDAISRSLRAIIAAGAVLLAIVFFFPVISGITIRGHVSWCRDNLKSIGVALHAYHDKWATFPPAHLLDEAARPAHSWRVLLLPFMKSAPFSSEHDILFDRYQFHEPWDGPTNLRLMSMYSDHESVLRPVRLYQCRAWPGVDDNGLLTTHYLALIGNNTAWGGLGARSLQDIAHPEQTILVIECFDRAVPWLEPRDISLEEAAVVPPIDVCFLGWWLGRTRSSRIPYYPGEPGMREYHRYMGRHALFADGSVRLLPNDLSPADLRALADIRDVPKPVLPAPPPDREAVPDVIQRLPFPAVTIRWAGFVLFLAALAAMARWVKPAPMPAARENSSKVARQTPP